MLRDEWLQNAARGTEVPWYVLRDDPKLDAVIGCFFLKRWLPQPGGLHDQKAWFVHMYRRLQSLVDAEIERKRKAEEQDARNRDAVRESGLITSPFG